MLLALAGLGFVLLVRPSLQLVKTIGIHRNLAAAGESVRAGKMEEARDLALSVIQSGDRQIAARRIVERAMDALNDSRHQQSALALLAHPDAHDEDRFLGFRTCCREMPMAKLGGVWLSLPEQCRLDPRFALAFADRQISERMLEEATSVLLAIPEAKRNSRVLQRLVRIMLRTGKAGDLDQAQRWIARNWEDSGEAAAGWLELLEEIPLSAIRPDLLRGVELRLAAPEFSASARHRMVLARILFAAAPLDPSHTIEAAIGSGVGEGGQWLARFLIDAGCADRVLELMPPASHIDRPDLAPLLLEAAERAKAWDDLEHMLENPALVIPTYERHGRLAVMFADREDHELNEHSRLALIEAKCSNHSGALLELAGLYSRAGMADEARKAMVEAILHQKGPLPAYRFIDPMVRDLLRRDEEDLALRICASCIRLEPGDPSLTVLYAYLAVMNDLVGPELHHESLRAIADKRPDDAAAGCALAAVLLQMGQVEKALGAVKNWGPDSLDLTPSQQAVVLTTMVLGGRIHGRDARVRDFDWNHHLLSSERRKFKSWILNLDAEAFSP